ncbi:MAG TPA: DR2241 family protein [Chthoniobacterales bacterium]
MEYRITGKLRTLLEAERRLFFGEIQIDRLEGGGYAVTHHRDAGRGDLILHNDAYAAREIAKFDAAGNYRPLKSAPNLQRGWKLILPDAESLRLALDFFYPAMLGTWLGTPRPVHLRETLNRQTGMYRVAAKLMDPEADRLIGEVCDPKAKCLKTILWRIDEHTPITTLPPEKFDLHADLLGRTGRCMSLPCEEACNVLVAAAREVVKTPAE